MEAANKTLKKMLLKMSLDDESDDWLYYLDKATSVYNNKVHSSTQKTPFEALIGQPKRLALVSYGSPRKRRAAEEADEEFAREKHRRRRKSIHAACTLELERARIRMMKSGNTEIPVLAIGDVCLQDVPPLDRGHSLRISSVTVKVLKILKNHTYRVMYKDGSVSQRAAHISTLERVSPTFWQPEWKDIYEARENSKKPLRTAVRMY